MSTEEDNKQDCRRLDVEASPWNMCNFYGRWRYYQWITDPRLIVASPLCVQQSRELLRLYELKKEPPGTTVELVAYAKRVYEGSVHPDTGCKVPHSARFSSMPAVQMALTAAMVTFCRTMPAVWFWQLVHNGYHAHVNWANGNATAPRTRKGQAVALGSAAVMASLFTIPFKSKLSRATCRSRFRSLVPLTVVLLSHTANVPLSRQNELVHGVNVYDGAGRHCGSSRTAATKGICQVVLSRMVLFAPSMIIVPMLTPIMERRCVAHRNRWVVPIFQALLSTALITLMIPVSCALFPQTAQINTEALKHIDHELHEKVTKGAMSRCESIPTHVFFNKGL